ncbi:hypothetical protein PC117_g26101 [Phytophthora cactorum]|uniref:Uncharacterized protein n=1 Tax=Phytophthora cactorum TaxID=29920 RepID=A0A8T1AMK7_9STRA|nr:hypothetical protein PC117_g26101 [Phytophthora cactorum]
MRRLASCQIKTPMRTEKEVEAEVVVGVEAVGVEAVGVEADDGQLTITEAETQALG